MNRIYTLLLVTIICLPLVVGCGGSASSITGTSIVESENAAQEDSGFVRANISPSFQFKRKFNYNKSAHKIVKKLRENLQKVAARIKFDLLSDTSTDNISMVISAMKIKSADSDQIITIKGETTVNLLDAQSLGALLAQQELPAGKYSYIEFSVKSATITEDGKTYKVKVPTSKIRFAGNYELQDGYETAVSINFSHKLIKNPNYKETKPKTIIGAVVNAIMGGGYKYTLVPICKISSDLTPIVQEVEDPRGDVKGNITHYINGSNLSGITVALEGTEFSTTTDANGVFELTNIPVGNYVLKASNDDYADASFDVEISTDQVSEIAIQMNPAVIRSTIGNTGWFSQYYPLADINGQYGEVGLETPISIDYVSMAFVKAEISFTGVFHESGLARMEIYLGTDQMVSADRQEGYDWWAGNTFNGGIHLGQYFAGDIEEHSVVDITDVIKQNPSNLYFFAAKNLSYVDVRVKDIQISIYYK